MTPKFQPSSGGLHGRRRGKKISLKKTEYLNKFLPELLLPLADISSLENICVACAELRIEIGFGSGEMLLHSARNNPHINFIGCEPFINGMAKVVRTIVEENIGNIRLFQGDAASLLQKIPPNSVQQIDLFFPDPWPKRRQTKRRFVSNETVNNLARALVKGGLWRFATDIDDYAGWTLHRLLNSSEFIWSAETKYDWLVPYRDWIPTRYENKAREANRTPMYFSFVRAI